MSNLSDNDGGMSATRTCESLKVVDSHTGGEPTRAVVEWPASVAGLEDGSLSVRRQHLAERYDWIRRACILEPRGHDAMVGALLCPPENPACVTGVIFFNNVGYLNGCVHGTIGVTATLAHLGRIGPGKHRIETPVGEVVAELHADGRVTVANVPSYRYRKDVEIEVPGHGMVRGDIAWGGNWFFLTHTPDGRKDLAVRPENIGALTGYAADLAHALEQQGVCGQGGMKVDHVEVFGEATPGHSDSRSFVLCPGMEYDRSPCGTGTSAKLACLFADGDLAAGRVWRQASILDTVFEGWVEALDGGRVQPMISGRAYVNGESRLIIDPEDPFRHGIALDQGGGPAAG